MRRHRRAITLLASLLVLGCPVDEDPFYQSFADRVRHTGDSVIVVVRTRRLVETEPSPARIDTALASIERNAAAFAALSPPDSTIGVTYDRMRAALDSLVVGVRTLRNFFESCTRPDSSMETFLACGEPDGLRRIRNDITTGMRAYSTARRSVRRALADHGVSLAEEP